MPRVVILLALILAAAACGTARPAGGEAPGCGSCHAFPPATVAAHAEAPGGTWEAAECATCHATSVDGATGAVLPPSTGGTHGDGTVDSGHAPFGDTTGDATDGELHGAAANAGIATCQACHGAALDGGTAGVSCLGCHTGPFAFTNCTLCHGTFTASYTPARLAEAAPPEDVGGATAISEVTVGLHQAHVATTLAQPVACSACHGEPTPASVFDAGHVDGSPAEVPFAGIAVTGGAAPVWDRPAATCAATWCHDRGGSRTTWIWTAAGAADCASCHGSPPASGQHDFHVERGVTCGACHAGYGLSTVDAAIHVDGTVDAKAIPSCHCGSW